MNEKQELLAGLMSVRREWQGVLESHDETMLTAPRLPGGWSVRDVITHLAAWQQISAARLQAALQGTQPEYPGWLGGADPFYAEEHTEQFNDRIVELQRRQSWPDIRQGWQDGFERFVELAQAVPGQALFDAQRFAWMNGYPLEAVLSGSRQHHEEHLRECAAALV